MPSSMPRLLAGPCLSVTFPAPSSIFLTSPSMASCAATAVASKAAASAVAAVCISLLNFIFFPFDRLKFGLGRLISLIAVPQSPFTCLSSLSCPFPSCPTAPSACLYPLDWFGGAHRSAAPLFRRRSCRQDYCTVLDRGSRPVQDRRGSSS